MTPKWLRGYSRRPNEGERAIVACDIENRPPRRPLHHAAGTEQSTIACWPWYKSVQVCASVEMRKSWGSVAYKPENADTTVSLCTSHVSFSCLPSFPTCLSSQSFDDGFSREPRSAAVALATWQQTWNETGIASVLANSTDLRLTLTRFCRVIQSYKDSRTPLEF